MLTYTAAEYDDMLQDPSWSLTRIILHNYISFQHFFFKRSKAQTERLYSLCRRYDLRFLVIHDKFTHPSPSDEEGLPLNNDCHSQLFIHILHKYTKKNCVLKGVKALAEEEKTLGLNGGKLLSKNKTVEDLKARYYGMQVLQKNYPHIAWPSPSITRCILVTAIAHLPCHFWFRRKLFYFHAMARTST